MLDIKFIRENQELVKASLKNRNLKFELGPFLDLDDSRRKALSELESLLGQRNKSNDDISAVLK